MVGVHVVERQFVAELMCCPWPLCWWQHSKCPTALLGRWSRPKQYRSRVLQARLAQFAGSVMLGHLVPYPALTPDSSRMVGGLDRIARTRGFCNLQFWA